MTPETAALASFACYGAVALALILSVGLFLGTKTELRRLERQIAGERTVREEALAGLREAMETLEGRRAADRVETAPANCLSPMGLNVSKRTHVLRLHRSGQCSRQIAAAVGVPENEVSLLLKLHGMLMEQC